MILSYFRYKDLKIKSNSTLSSSALWCSNRDLSAFNTSASEETPEFAESCVWRLTTVIRNDFSCLDTNDSKCSNNN